MSAPRSVLRDGGWLFLDFAPCSERLFRSHNMHTEPGKAADLALWASGRFLRSLSIGMRHRSGLVPEGTSAEVQQVVIIIH